MKGHREHFKTRAKSRRLQEIPRTKLQISIIPVRLNYVKNPHYKNKFKYVWFTNKQFMSNSYF